MLIDTNGDGIADFLNGKVVVPASPTAAENAAAANLAARLGYGTTGLTPPVVVAGDPGRGPRIVVSMAPTALLPCGFEKEEGGVLQADDSLLIARADGARSEEGRVGEEWRSRWGA